MVRLRTAQLCFFSIGCGIFLTGLVYALSSTVMPYHLEAMGIAWKQLPKGQQLVMLAIQRGSGTGMIAAGVSILLLLFFPFKKGENWARWGLLSLPLIECLPAIYSIIQLKMHTPGRPPLFVLVLVVVLTLLGFICSPNKGKARG